MNILDALDDRQIFAEHFRGPTWDTWRVFLAALFALPLTPEQLAVYQKHTGRSSPPTVPLHEGWLICGRRSGKSFMLACIATWLATFKDWRPFLGPGEVGTLMVIAADRKQSRVIMRYIVGLLKSVPMLSQLIEAETQESVQLRNCVVIEVHTASFRSTRGYSCVACLCDEIAFWPSDEFSAAPDIEVLAAIRPSMSTIPGAMLLCASSPYARKGALWDARRKHYGKDASSVLVWQAATREMNASVPQAVIDAAMEEDLPRAGAEWLAQFRTDVESFVSIEAVRACVSADVRERPPQSNVHYHAFVDPSGGSADSMTLAIGHKAGDVIVVDCLREVKPPFSPQSVVAEFVERLKSYRVSRVVGDRFGGEWPREQFRNLAIRYELAEQPKSSLYQSLLPRLNSGRIQLLDNARLISQLCGLERRTARGGRDSIDHGPGSHDDVANSVAGLAGAAKYGSYPVDLSWVSNRPSVSDADADEKARREFEEARFRAHLMRYARAPGLHRF
jgi:hypothetical protein